MISNILDATALFFWLIFCVIGAFLIWDIWRTLRDPYISGHCLNMPEWFLKKDKPKKDKND